MKLNRDYYFIQYYITIYNSQYYIRCKILQIINNSIINLIMYPNNVISYEYSRLKLRYKFFHISYNNRKLSLIDFKKIEYIFSFELMFW